MTDLDSGTTERDYTRRGALKLGAGLAAGGLAMAAARPAAAGTTDLTEWFANTGNADGVADRTGQSEVTVRVGTDGNGAAFGYGPAAVRVDPGTTVVWEWTGEGGRHNVVAQDGSFQSDYHGESGATFEHTFESAGVTKYYCTPHKVMGMKGAVIVGDAEVTVSESGSGGGSSGNGGGTATSTTGGTEPASVDPDYGGWFSNVGNFEGTVDRTGQDEVRIKVGAQGNGGPFAFDPPAVHVDPGTTVIWEWTGEGGQHNVTSDDPEFDSGLKSEAGATYGLQFDGSGVCKYYCTPHEAAGMKGAVVVGDPAEAGGTSIDYLETGLWGLAGAIVATPYVASEVLARRRGDDGNE